MAAKDTRGDEDRLGDRSRRVDERVRAQAQHAGKTAEEIGAELVPAWLRPTPGEHRWQMGLAVLATIALQVWLPARLALSPHDLLPIAEGAVLLGLFVASPTRIQERNRRVRGAALLLIALVTLDNAASASLLSRAIVEGKADSGAKLLLEGVAIWCTNVIVFGLWYWEFDRGGPAARAEAVNRYPDLLFPQMQQPDTAPPDWEPAFFDYLYTSFTNATAFSPTDTMPMSRWAKALFLVQSAISLATVGLVIARAVNILNG